MYFTSKPVTVIESGRLETTKLNFVDPCEAQESGDCSSDISRGISTQNSPL